MTPFAVVNHWAHGNTLVRLDVPQIPGLIRTASVYLVSVTETGLVAYMQPSSDDK